MATDTIVSFAAGCVVPVRGGIIDVLLMTRGAGLVYLGSLEPWPSARSMAMVAVELAGFHAGAHHPRSMRVVLAQVAAVRVIVLMVKYGEVIGVASESIGVGAWVHTHNVESATVPTSAYGEG